MATVKIGGRPYLDTSGAPKIEDLLSVNGALQVYIASLLAGEDQSLGVLRIAPFAKPYLVTTSNTQVITGPCIVYGFTTTAGTTPTLTLYDGISTSGTKIYGGATETVGVAVRFGCAIYCATGLYAAPTGTSEAFTIYALAAA